MDNLSLDAKYLDMLRNIFINYCPEAEIFAYGSRVNGKSHDGSDLDLVIKNFPKEKTLSELRALLSESNIPFLIDINVYENLPETFQKEIDKNSVKIYSKNLL